MAEGKTMHVLVLGAPGVGKSTLAPLLREAGMPALDTGINVKWGSNGAQLERGASAIWMATHQAKVDRPELDQFLRQNSRAVVLGACFDLAVQAASFDRVIYLTAPAGIIQDRLLTRQGNNFGTTLAQRAFALGVREAGDLIVRLAMTVDEGKYFVVGVSRPIQEVTANILRICALPT